LKGLINRIFNSNPAFQEASMPGSERKREIRRRRHRRTKTKWLRARAVKASASEKVVLAAKLRGLTPGAEQIIQELELESR
jgi:hypothetical protein